MYVVPYGSFYCEKYPRFLSTAKIEFIIQIGHRCCKSWWGRGGGKTYLSYRSLKSLRHAHKHFFPAFDAWIAEFSIHCLKTMLGPCLNFRRKRGDNLKLWSTNSFKRFRKQALFQPGIYKQQYKLHIHIHEWTQEGTKNKKKFYVKLFSSS